MIKQESQYKLYTDGRFIFDMNKWEELFPSIKFHRLDTFEGRNKQVGYYRTLPQELAIVLVEYYEGDDIKETHKKVLASCNVSTIKDCPCEGCHNSELCAEFRLYCKDALAYEMKQWQPDGTRSPNRIYYKISQLDITHSTYLIENLGQEILKEYCQLLKHLTKAEAKEILFRKYDMANPKKIDLLLEGKSYIKIKGE